MVWHPRTLLQGRWGQGRSWWRPGAEAAGLTLVLWSVGWWVFQDGAWTPWAGAPLLLVPAVLAAVHGLRGLVTSAPLAALALGPLALTPAAAAALLVAGAVVFLRAWILARLESTRRRFRDLVVRNHRLRRENRALAEASRLLEARLSRQRRYLPHLLARLHRLEGRDRVGLLEGLLDVVQAFAAAERASVWRHDPEGRRVVVEAAVGSPPEALAPRSDEASVEGWVCRNGSPATLRTGFGGAGWSARPEGAPLLCFPIKIGDRVWGALSIESLPFAQFSRYTETVLEIILLLVGRSLATVLDREALFTRQEVHSRTALPLASVLVRVLGDEMARHQRVGVVILEVARSPDLDGDLDRLVALVQGLGGPGTEVFHYKAAEQLAFLLRGRDLDGTALFCLDLLGALHEPNRFPGGRPPEVLVGYDVPREGLEGPTDLLEHAERLIRMQKP